MAPAEFRQVGLFVLLHFRGAWQNGTVHLWCFSSTRLWVLFHCLSYPFLFFYQSYSRQPLIAVQARHLQGCSSSMITSMPTFFRHRHLFSSLDILDEVFLADVPVNCHQWIGDVRHFKRHRPDTARVSVERDLLPVCLNSWPSATKNFSLAPSPLYRNFGKQLGWPDALSSSTIHSDLQTLQLPLFVNCTFLVSRCQTQWIFQLWRIFFLESRKIVC